MHIANVKQAKINLMPGRERSKYAYHMDFRFNYTCQVDFEIGQNQ